MGFIWVDDKEDDQKFKTHLESKISEATTSLSTANEGLKGDLTKLKKKVKEKEDIDVDEFNRLKAENEQLRNKHDDDDNEVIKSLKVANKQLSDKNENLEDRLNTLETDSKASIMDGAIAKALVNSRVKDSMMRSAEKIIRADVAVVVKDGKRVAVVGEKTVEEYVKEWAQTEEGKNFIKADVNNGGGGGDGSGVEFVESDWEIYFKSETRNYTKQVLLKRQNPALYKKLIEKYKN